MVGIEPLEGELVVSEVRMISADNLNEGLNGMAP